MAKYQSEDPCVACGEEYLDRCYHHVTTRGAGGTDDPRNRMSLCLVCHNLIHQKGTVWMFSHKRRVKLWLIEHERWDILEREEK